MISSDRNVRSGALHGKFSDAAYCQLAEFRYRIRKFLHFREETAQSCHIESQQQHQLLLAIKGLPEGSRPTVTALSHRLCLRHHSTVELVDRLVKRDAVTRRHNDQDHREVFIELTPHGGLLRHRLSALLWQELRITGPALAGSFLAALHHWIEMRKGLE
jgi:DNA-binding MarR family transcriptional regulator